MVRRLRIGDEIHAGGSVLRVVGWDNGRLLLECEPLTPAVRFVKRVEAVEVTDDGRVRTEVSRKSTGRISEAGTP